MASIAMMSYGSQKVMAHVVVCKLDGMNATEARGLLRDVLATYRGWSYEQLCAKIAATTEHRQIVGPSGVTYQITIRMWWDAQPQGNVRVGASIDDGGLRAFVPLTNDFIKAPDGSFVGESDLANYVGKTIIVGLSYRDYGEEIKSQHQFHGEIVRVNLREGVVVRLASGEERRLPPDPRTFKPAPPGEYRFRSTGEVIVNPDLMTTWFVDPARDMWKAIFAWFRQVVSPRHLQREKERQRHEKG
jgi:hypothetical protein